MNIKKEWGEHTTEEREAVLKTIAAVYDSLGHPEWLKDPTSTDQFVNDLKAGKQLKQCFLSFESNVPIDKKELAAEVTAKLTEATAGVDKVQIAIAAKYGVGSQIGTLANVSKVFEAGQTDLVHKEGEVWLCDLWATWCPPCQKPMAHNQDMLEKRADWEGKARILGLSIDNDTETVKNHVTTKMWQKVEHYLCGEGCSVSDEYGSGGVPHIFLVDQKGKIVFMGHPSERNLEEDIDKLIKGEEITGKGTGAGAAASSDAAVSGTGEASATQNEDAISEAKSKFLTDTKAFAEDPDMKELFAQLNRGFIVLVDEQVHSMKDGKTSHDLNCHTQLMGPGDVLDKLEPKAKTINQNELWANKDMFKKN